MRNVFTILLLFVIGIIAYTFFVKHLPCEDPIPYALGVFDTEFGITEKYFLSALAEAEAVWEKPTEIDLFTYTPEDTREDTRTDTLKINLVYDYRQQATLKLKSLGIVVQNTKASYDTLKAKFIALKAEYERDKNIFAKRVADFNKRNSDYEREVKSWNQKGGAPEQDYKRLQATQASLQKESQVLEDMQRNLNEQVEEINAMVVVLNRLADTLNLSVEKYNTVNTSRGESFEEGVYVSSGGNQEIDIYEFSSREKLVRVLAHELGHALRLPHVEDPKAIMYKLNQGNNMTLTEADMNALKAECNLKE